MVVDASASTPDSYVRARLQALPTFARELIAGGLAGGLAKTCVAPLERTKIIFQTRGGSSVLGVLQHIWVNEGPTGLFRGNTASVLRIVPYAAIHFGSYEYFRRAIVQLAAGGSQQQQAGHQHQQHQQKPLWDLLAGAASGATAVATTYPLDLVRTRLAWATEAPAAAAAVGGGRSRVPGVWATLASTARDEGLAGLYRGVNPTLLGILPYAGLKFYVYQALKNVYRSWADDDAVAVHQQPQQHIQQQQPHQNHKHKLPMGVTLVIGGLAGLVAQTLTYPLDVVRRHMQVQHLRDKAPPSNWQPGRSSSSSGGGTGQHLPGVVAAAGDAKPTTAAPAAAGSSHISSSGNSRSIHQQRSQLAARQPRPVTPALVAARRHMQNSSSTSSSKDPHLPVAGTSCAGASGRWLQAGAVRQHQWRLVTGGGVRCGPAPAPRLTTLSVTRALLAEGGVQALFRGLSINYLKVVPSTAIGFTCYDALKAFLGLSGSTL